MDDQRRNQIREDEEVRHAYRQRQGFYGNWITAFVVAAAVFGLAMSSTNISWQPALGFAALLGIIIGFGQQTS